MQKNNKSQSGQILLIIVLISSVLLTIGLSLSQVGSNETKISKLEEESKKTFQAAEAGIENFIQNNAGNYYYDKSNNIGIGVSVNIINSNQKSAKEFITPLIKKDEQYTFYLIDYPDLVAGNSNSWTGNSLDIYFNSNKSSQCDTSSSSEPAIELTLIYDDSSTSGYELKKYLVDNCSGRIGTPNLTVSSGDSDYLRKTTLSITESNPKVLIVRNIFSDTKIKFIGNTDLKNQGKYITSTAQSTNNNVTKKVELFQSYPQIPADFFVTSF